MTARAVTVGELLIGLADRFPLEWAEPWDAVGLRVGDRTHDAGRVYVTLDADIRAVESAHDAGCNTLVTHHPPFLGKAGPITGDTAEGRFILTAASRGLAVISMHTNLDRSPEGGDALALLLGLTPERPLEESVADVDVVTVFVSPEGRAEVFAAMAAAGAGRIGRYEACSFTARGQGRFTPRSDADPATGGEGPSAEPEDRVEMVVPAGGGAAVVSAARAVHPYEEPVILVTRTQLSRGVARLGRVCSLETTSLALLAADVGRRVGVQPRVWGDGTAPIERVAVANGSGGSLVGAALASGAQAMIAGEVRYHDAMMAVSAGLAIVEAGHDATEWPLVNVLAQACRAVLGHAEVIEAAPSIGWWTVERA